MPCKPTITRKPMGTHLHYMTCRDQQRKQFSRERPIRYKKPRSVAQDIGSVPHGLKMLSPAFLAREYCGGFPCALQGDEILLQRPHVRGRRELRVGLTSTSAGQVSNRKVCISFSSRTKCRLPGSYGELHEFPVPPWVERSQAETGEAAPKSCQHRVKH